MAGKKYKKPHRVLDYKVLFETLSPREFLGDIFFSHHFTVFNCIKHKIDFKYRFKAVNRVFSYFHEDDLYRYFQINHSLHKDKSKYEYINTLCTLMSDLIDQTPSIEFTPLEDQAATPTYVYYDKELPKLSNIARDFYGHSEVKLILRKEVLQFKEYKEHLKEIYQRELLPLDITQQSFF